MSCSKEFQSEQKSLVRYARARKEMRTRNCRSFHQPFPIVKKIKRQQFNNKKNICYLFRITSIIIYFAFNDKFSTKIVAHTHISLAEYKSKCRTVKANIEISHNGSSNQAVLIVQFASFSKWISGCFDVCLTFYLTGCQGVCYTCNNRITMRHQMCHRNCLVSFKIDLKSSNYRCKKIETNKKLLLYDHNKNYIK